MYERKIICLANSRKPPSGRCVAGKRISDDELAEWIRPVSARATREVSEEERRYEEGTKARLLDIITIPLLQALPAVHQTENHVLAEDYYWVKEGEAGWEQVQACVDPYDPNFWVVGESTYHGSNDKIPEARLPQIYSSLKLIQVPDLRVLVRAEAGYGGAPARRRVRGRFTYQGSYYLLAITDPEIEEEYLTRGNGEYLINDSALCISIAEAWNEYAFRLIASVITAERCSE